MVDHLAGAGNLCREAINRAKVCFDQADNLVLFNDARSA
jgi:hypothetical protein